MSDNYFNPVFTDVGRSAAASDSGQGLQTVITDIAFGDAKYAVRDAEGVALDVAASATALQGERWRTIAEAGGSPAPGVLNLVAEVTKAEADDPQFFISEVGFFNADGVLIAIWSSDTVNLGYRGDVMSWFLSLGLAWFDLPGDMFTVEVLNAPLSQQMLGQARLRNQIHDVVVGSGVDYKDDDRGALKKALDLRFSEMYDKFGRAVRSPICVYPTDGSDDVEIDLILRASSFFSADSYEHVASQFRIYSDDIIVFDSGELEGVTEYRVPAELLETSSVYEWDVAFKGKLGSYEVWSDFSEKSRFETTGIAIYNLPPTLISPVNEASSVSVRPVLSISAYESFPVGYDSVDAVQFQIYSDSELQDLVWDSGVVTESFQSVSVPVDLTMGQRFYWVARQRGGIIGWTDYSEAFYFDTTKAQQGTVLSGGWVVVGQMNGYWLACAPASKRGEMIPFGLYGLDTEALNFYSLTEPDPQSGWDRTNIYIDNYSTYNDGSSVGPGAAIFCRNQGASSFLPNMSELLMILDNVDMIEALDETQGVKFSDITKAIWTSTEQNSSMAIALKVDGSAQAVIKQYQRHVVPVLRIPV